VNFVTDFEGVSHFGSSECANLPPADKQFGQIDEGTFLHKIQLNKYLQHQKSILNT